MAKYYQLISLWDSASNTAKAVKTVYDEIAAFINANSELTVTSREDTPGLSVISQKQGICDGLRMYINGSSGSYFFGGSMAISNYQTSTGSASVVIGGDKKSFGIGFTSNGGFNVDCFYSKCKNVLTNSESGMWISSYNGSLYSILDDDSTTAYGSFGMPKSSYAPRTSEAITLAKLYSPVNNALCDSLYMDFFAPNVSNSILVELDGKIYARGYMGTTITHSIWLPVAELPE